MEDGIGDQRLRLQSILIATAISLEFTQSTRERKRLEYLLRNVDLSQWPGKVRLDYACRVEKAQTSSIPNEEGKSP